MKKVILILSLLFMTSSSTAVNLKNLQVMDDGDYYACAISASIARIIMEKRQYNSADLEEMKGSIDMMLENAKKTIGTNINQVDYAILTIILPDIPALAFQSEIKSDPKIQKNIIENFYSQVNKDCMFSIKKAINDSK